MKLPTVPPATADPEQHADWLELTALRAADLSSSIGDLFAVVRRGGTAEEVAPPGGLGAAAVSDRNDSSGERALLVAEEAFAALERRETACAGAYPFEVGPRHIRVVGGSYFASTYMFLLALSAFGKDDGPRGSRPEKLLEELSAVAAEAYLGATPGGRAHSYVFGFPRRRTPAGFNDALDGLCQQLGEGLGASRRPESRDQKDARLDIVAWKSFGDMRSTKVIGFGQCATGRNWKDKLGDMLPAEFQRVWLREALQVDPIRMFFVPHAIPDADWHLTGVRAGVLFDRCRIADLARVVPERIRLGMTEWTQAQLRRTA